MTSLSGPNPSRLPFLPLRGEESAVRNKHPMRPVHPPQLWYPYEKVQKQKQHLGLMFPAITNASRSDQVSASCLSFPL